MCLQNSLGNLNFTMMKKFWFVAIFTIFSDIKPVQTECRGSFSHCAHLCQSSGKYNCLSTSGNGHIDSHGCECLPQDYCDHRYSCKPTDVVCLHNEAIRCNGNNTCECYCSKDSQCHNCPAGTLGFCVNEKCVCETNNYCPSGNKLYCLRNFQCAHSESKRCNQNDRCECFCNIDTDCKNCPEKGFCVDFGCVCESQDYCPKGNHMYCFSLSCERGYTSKCNSTNHCYCAYVPDTCSNHDVSKCYHLTCSPGEKKYCGGRTCTCKPLDYCQQNDADCQHKTCDASKAEIGVCLSGTCGCLAVPDFCGGDDASTCQHIICNQYQVKKCENGMCKCQVNPSCNAQEGLNSTCTRENTYLEVKGSDGQTYYANCNDSFHFPLCIGDRCQCVYWKTPPPPSTSESSTTPVSSMTDMSALTVTSSINTQTTLSMTGSINPSPTAATCASRMDCNQQNTHVMFLTFTMPCPLDHIDCVNNECFCIIDKITTSRAASTTTQKISTTTASSTSVGATANVTNTTQKVSTTTASSTSVGSTASTTSTTQKVSPTTASPTSVSSTAQKVSPTTASSNSVGSTAQKVSHTTASPTSVGSTAITTHTTQTVLTSTAFSTSVGSTPNATYTGLTCSACDDKNPNCVWNQTCSLGEVCLIQNTPFTVHCSKKQDCIFIKTLVKEIKCCEDHQCISENAP